MEFLVRGNLNNTNGEFTHAHTHTHIPTPANYMQANHIHVCIYVAGHLTQYAWVSP